MRKPGLIHKKYWAPVQYCVRISSYLFIGFFLLDSVLISIVNTSCIYHKDKWKRFILLIHSPLLSITWCWHYKKGSSFSENEKWEFRLIRKKKCNSLLLEKTSQFPLKLHFHIFHKQKGKFWICFRFFKSYIDLKICQTILTTKSYYVATWNIKKNSI